MSDESNIKYIVVVGSVEPRKNIILVIDACSQLGTEYQSQSSLVVIGALGWQNVKVRRAAKKLDQKMDCMFLGYMPESAVIEWYKKAFVVICPSLDEGFGYPPLEAMAVGTPVIVSDAPALVEISGNGAIIVKRDDPTELACILTELMNNKEARKLLGAKGTQHVQEFTLDKVITNTVSIYKKYLGMH
jgi:alpha-1,3-rhamnosyl/mannosyltransferase